MMPEPAMHPIIIRAEGVLDVPAANRAVEALSHAGDGEVLVDLTHVREFHDLGVAVLARALAGRTHATVLGLRQHHVRLLRYLGIDTGAADLGSFAELV